MPQDTKVKPVILPKPDVQEMIWTLLRDRIVQDANSLAGRKVSYIRQNRVPGGGE